MRPSPSPPASPGGPRPVTARVRLLMLAGLAACPVLLPADGSRGRAPAHSAAFLVYYGRDPAAPIDDYRIAVLDSEMPHLGKRNRLSMRLGYLSVGQVHKDRPYFPDMDRDGLLLEADPNWPDARFVDLRAPRWRERLLDEIVPAVLAAGFRGLFLDTLDSAEALELRDPKRFAGTVDAAASLVSALRRRTARRPLMINRGYAVLPRVAGQFDMLLGESVSATFGDERYRLVTPEARAWQVQRMTEAKRRDPALRLFALDYWDPQDLAGVARLYAEERASGFIPYVATPSLTQVITEP